MTFTWCLSSICELLKGFRSEEAKSLAALFCCTDLLPALTNEEEDLWSFTALVSVLCSFSSFCWSRENPAAMSVGTKETSCNTRLHLRYWSSSTSVITLRRNWRMAVLQKLLLTEKKSLNNSAMLAIAAWFLSLSVREQKRTRSRYSHTLLDQERILERSRRNMFLCGRLGLSRGSKVSSTPSTVNSRMVQLRNRKSLSFKTVKM